MSYALPSEFDGVRVLLVIWGQKEKIIRDCYLQSDIILISFGKASSIVSVNEEGRAVEKLPFSLK